MISLGSDIVGTMDPGAIINSGASFTLNLGDDLWFTGANANNQINGNTGINLFTTGAVSSVTIDYAGTINAADGNGLSGLITTPLTALNPPQVIDITLQSTAKVTAAGTSDVLGVPTKGGGVILANTLTNAVDWKVTNKGTFDTANDGIFMVNLLGSGTHAINNDGFLGTSAKRLGGSGAIILAPGVNYTGGAITLAGDSDGTINNNDGEIWTAGGGFLGLFGGAAVVVGGDAKVTNLKGLIDTTNGPGVLSVGGASSTVDSRTGSVTSANGPGIIAATLGSGATIIDSGTVNAGSGAFAGISLPSLPTLGTLSLSGGVIGISGTGGSTVNAHGDISVASGGTFGLGAISTGGSATSHLNGNKIDPPAIGQFAIVLGGTGDATVETDGGIVEATTIGLLGLNTGTGDIIIKNDDDGTVTPDGAGLIALKFGASNGGDDSVRITNTGSLTGSGGPGMGVIALGGDNNVTIDNTGNALIRGKGDNLLNAAIGVIADGAVKITNDLNSTIDTKNGLVDGTFGINVGAAKDIIVRNDHNSDIVGTAILGSTSGSVTFTNDNQSTWTSEGISVLGALGSGQYATLDNLGGSEVKITNGLLAMAADVDVEINNIYGLDINSNPLRSSIEFGGSSGNLMIAGNDARITNDGSDFKMGNFTPGIGANLMFAGNDAEIINKNGATFSMTNLVNGNYMNADRDSRIQNLSGSTFTMSGINGNAVVADRDAEIINSGSSTFTLNGISGNFMFSDSQDAKITNEKGSTFSMTGILNGNIMIAERDALMV